MPAVFERVFRARYDECDAYGKVNRASYLRFMQEAAFDASTDIGYDFATYKRMNRNWLIRESEISFLQPLHYGDTVIVKTWVADFRRALSQRRYEFRLQETHQLAATAYTDWVFLDTFERWPAKIPPHMIQAFIPDCHNRKPPTRQRFPVSPQPGHGVYRCSRQVHWGDIDSAHHVNNAVYMTYLEDCENELLHQKGWSAARMMAFGFYVTARNFRIEYRLPARMDDALEIATWLTDVQKETAVRHYTVQNCADGKLLTQARALLEWVDLETGQPIPIPNGFAADLLENISGQKIDTI